MNVMNYLQGDPFSESAQGRARGWTEQEHAALVSAYVKRSAAECPVCQGVVGVLAEGGPRGQRLLFRCRGCGNMVLVAG